jgi:hypothetical protein
MCRDLQIISATQNTVLIDVIQSCLNSEPYYLESGAVTFNIYKSKREVLWIRDILVRICTTNLRIRLGYGSCSFRQWLSRCQTKINWFASYFLKVHLNQSSKVKFIKKSQKKSRVFLLILLDDVRIRIQIRTNNHGFGTWSPKNLRIRIHRTGQE